MAALADIYFKKETLQTILDVLNKKEEKGVSITVSINDESNQWGQNVSAYVSQSKEDREAKKAKFYTGNGKVFWNDGKISNGVKPEEQTQQQSYGSSSSDVGEESPLPF